MTGTSQVDVAVVGAGPYGLSVAAHLRARGLDTRVIGRPMHSWQHHMPRGMLLKSEGFASNLSDPTARHTLRSYCAQQGVRYADQGAPVSAETFVDYGRWFQRHHVREVDETEVAALGRANGVFELRLATGEAVMARRVVLAVGVVHFARMPEWSAALPDELASHSSWHHDLRAFKGRDVTVIGGGQSALETAALLHEAGAAARILVRAPSIRWNSLPNVGRRPLRSRLRHPTAGLCDSWPCWFYSNGPMAFRHLPQKTRTRTVLTALGPAGAWWLKDRVMGRLPVMLGQSVRAARPDGDRVRLVLETPEGRRELLTDHVIAATGYRVDLAALRFLNQDLVAGVRRANGAPVLSGSFESSVSGMYFVGLAAADCFGPVMRFVYGADFSARRVARHIAVAKRR